MVEVTLLGVAQDGARPQAGCIQPCCAGLTSDDTMFPVSLGIIDDSGAGHLIEATRYLGEQFRIWGASSLDSVWLTHAHFGHVDGLGLFGKETMASRDLDLHVSDEMFHLMEETPQWALMLKQGVFQDKVFQNGERITKNENFSIIPIVIPHRDELSDMHAFLICGTNKRLLFLPDHDSWQQTLDCHHQPDIRSWLRHLQVDIALLDGTFWSEEELGGRSQQDVPHPPVKQTLQLLGERKTDDPEIIFIHLNHTNPLYDESSPAYEEVTSNGWKVGVQGQTFTL